MFIDFRSKRVQLSYRPGYGMEEDRNIQEEGVIREGCCLTMLQLRIKTRIKDMTAYFLEIE